MPGNVQNAVAAATMPAHLADHFAVESQFPVRENVYADGRRQVAGIVAVDRKSFILTVPLTATKADAMVTFLNTIEWGAKPFYFYNRWETANFSYDETGASVTGRYLVRWDGPIAITVGRPRSRMPARLKQVA